MTLCKKIQFKKKTGSAKVRIWIGYLLRPRVAFFLNIEKSFLHREVTHTQSSIRGVMMIIIIIDHFNTTH